LTKINRILFNNLKNQNRPLAQQYLQAFSRIIDSGSYISNNEVKDFEENLSQFLMDKISYDSKIDKDLKVIGCSNGTSAIEISLRALNLDSQAEVLLPAMTFVATVEAVLSAGLRPVLIDIDEKTWTIDVADLEKSITKNTKVILPVNLHGRMVDLDKIWEIASKYDLIVIEDSAQAFNAKRNRNFAGATQSKASTFSFYPGKNLGALGEAGAITTFDQDFYDLCMRIRNWGIDPSRDRYNHEIRGNNFRMDEIQGAVLSIKLGEINEWTNKRIALGLRYMQNLNDCPSLELPNFDRNTEVHVFHIFNIIVPSSKRDVLRNKMLDLGIETGMHYPRAIHENKAYEDLGIGRTLSNSEKFAKSCLSLPINEYMSIENVDYVSENVLRLLRTI
jgi:dTDP-4-amino-4,6-dideoxygalactose transaminase